MINTSSPNPLPVIETIKQTFIQCYHYRLALLKALLVPALLLVALDYIVYYSDSGNKLLLLFFTLTDLAVYCYFSVTCHRIILLNKQDTPISGITDWGMRELKFMGWILFFILIAFLFYLIMASPFHLITKNIEDPGLKKAIILLLSTPLAYYFSRLSLLFPATATDITTNSKQVMELSRGNSIRLFVTVILFPVLLYFLLDFLTREKITLVEEIILTVLSFVFLILEIFALSLSYKFLSGEKDNPD